MTRNSDVLSTQPVVSPDELGPSYDLKKSEVGSTTQNVLAGVATLAVAGILLWGVNSREGNSSNSTSEKSPETAQQAAERCDSLDFESVASDASKYHSEAFLPMAHGVDTPRETRTYINGLFGNGPLAGKTDVASLSAVMAVVVQPAHDGAAADPNYDYTAKWGKNMQRYTSGGGREAAKKDCNLAYETLTQVAQYKEGWAKPGETITEFQAIRGDKNKIIGIKPVQVESLKNLNGIELDLRQTTKGLDGFTPVLISTTENGGWDGRLFVKGITKGQGGEAVKFDEKAIANANNQNNNTGGGQTGANQGKAGTGGAAGPNGTNPEAGPGGVTPSPGEGGGTTTTRPGGGTTTTTRPAPTTTTTTRPTPSTSTTTTTLPPKDTPSTLPKNPDGY